MANYETRAEDLARYIIYYSIKRERPISNLQLQKIMFFLQVVYCKKYKKLLFEDQFEAWLYGPVLPKIYKRYSLYGGSAIVEQKQELQAVPYGTVKDFIDSGIDYLASKSPWELVKISHAEGSPWAIMWDEGKGIYSTIPNSLILSIYK